VPYLKLAAVHDERAASLTLFALNRDLDDEIALEVIARGFSGLAVAQALSTHDDDLDAANTKDAPERIKPLPLEGVAVEKDRLRATLPPASWNVIGLASAA
jgi:alpha-L-arabinofuranosidase